MLLRTTTILARTPTLLLSQLSQLSKIYTENTLLFALSTNVEANGLSSLVSHLTSLSADSVGCLSAPLDTPWSPAEDYITCSLAAFDHSTTFRSTIPGRQAAQVGRLHAFRKHEDVTANHSEILQDGHVDWGKMWSRHMGKTTLPPELDSLS
jgi:hypothetical protein